MSAIPEISFGPAGISNWDEINQWAMRNDALWREIQRSGRRLNWSEIDTLRALAVILVKFKTEIL